MGVPPLSTSLMLRVTVRVHHPIAFLRCSRKPLGACAVYAEAAKLNFNASLSGVWKFE